MGIDDVTRKARRSAISWNRPFRKVASNYIDNRPRNRDEWVDRFCEALMSEAETSHHSVISALMAGGVSSQRFYQDYVPAAAHRLGEMWIADRASFIEVTLAASRLQALFRSGGEKREGNRLDRSIPLGQSVLLVIPAFESIRSGPSWLPTTFGATGSGCGFASGLMIVSWRKSCGRTAFPWWRCRWRRGKRLKMLDIWTHSLRTHVDNLPPVVAGGRIVSERAPVERITGADFAVKSVREAVERCGLAAVSEPLMSQDIN
ncbi:hypothetical protein [Roseovarius autotrophicus]|uniref:hypothetical protein n=1 Tax=Roseovarius autotrophicus TaxID=2824121 RepID=UPI001FFCD6FB|nr:hypothetical protein [Roseovarius autotrophicus]